MSPDLPVDILAKIVSEGLRVPHEVDIFLAVLRWAKYKLTFLSFGFDKTDFEIQPPCFPSFEEKSEDSFGDLNIFEDSVTTSEADMDSYEEKDSDDSSVPDTKIEMTKLSLSSTPKEKLSPESVHRDICHEFRDYPEAKESSRSLRKVLSPVLPFIR